MLEQIEFLVYNIYIQVGNRIYKQTILGHTWSNGDQLCSTFGQPFSLLLRVQIHERKTK